MKYLITGGCGFLGSNVAAEVLNRSEELHIIDSLYRTGSEANRDWLQEVGEFEFYQEDTRDRETIDKLVKKIQPDVIFHFAGQVAMTTSIADPRFDFETHVVGGLNILEAVREHCPEAVVFYSSTNKVYGDLEDIELKELETRYVTVEYPDGFSEDLRLDFRSPYGCSKGAVDQYMLDYHRIFGLKTVVFRHSSIFGGRQFPTFDQGWIGWFIQQAVETKRDPSREAFTISGDGKQVRDVLFAQDLISCYFKALDKIDKCAGQAFNIGGGIDNSLSLLELFHFLEEEMGIKLNFEQLPWRASDQRVFVADTSKALDYFGWEATVDKLAGTREMIEWIESVK